MRVMRLSIIRSALGFPGGVMGGCEGGGGVDSRGECFGVSADWFSR